MYKTLPVTDKPVTSIGSARCPAGDPTVMPVEHLEARLPLPLPRLPLPQDRPPPIDYHTIVPPHSGERLDLHEAIWITFASVLSASG